MRGEATPDGGTGRDDGRETARLLRNLGLGAAVFVMGMVVLALGSSNDDSAGPASVGPQFADEVSDYVTARHERLDGLDGRARAVVSFGSYVAAETASSTVPFRAERWLVAAPGGAPQVTIDPETWRAEFAAAARAEAAELESLIPTVEDDEFVAQYQADIDRALEMVEAIEAGDPVVFAVVVTANAVDLRRLRDDPMVRLVDPVEPDARGEPRGLRPEETEVVGEPAERPLA